MRLIVQSGRVREGVYSIQQIDSEVRCPDRHPRLDVQSTHRAHQQYPSVQVRIVLRHTTPDQATPLGLTSPEKGRSLSDKRQGRRVLLSYVQGNCKAKEGLHESVMSPEYELVFAVLDRALRDATSVCGENHIRRDAMRWFKSNETDPWTYLWICDTLWLTDTLVERIRAKALGYQS